MGYNYKNVSSDFIQKFPFRRLRTYTPTNHEIGTVGEVRTAVFPLIRIPQLTILKKNRSGGRVAQQELSKRVFDIVFSIVIMIMGMPVFAILYLITKVSSNGPAFYKQERVGKDNRTFHIYKFRSMQVDAEKLGPQLSSQTDPRITKWGRVIRRTRLDELPQFWNVLKGDMSVVGPRPERNHFIEKIIELNPDYLKLQSLKPGITSMGQVYFGYAENVEEMCERMKYDLNYLHTINLRTDLQVILKTVKVMVACKGK